MRMQILKSNGMEMYVNDFGQFNADIFCVVVVVVVENKIKRSRMVMVFDTFYEGSNLLCSVSNKLIKAIYVKAIGLLITKSQFMTDRKKKENTFHSRDVRVTVNINQTVVMVIVTTVVDSML